MSSDQLEILKDVVYYAFELESDLLRLAPKKLLNDKNFIIKIVKNKGYGLKYASDELKHDI